MQVFGKPKMARWRNDAYSEALASTGPLFALALIVALSRFGNKEEEEQAARTNNDDCCVGLPLVTLLSACGSVIYLAWDRGGNEQVNTE